MEIINSIMAKGKKKKSSSKAKDNNYIYTSNDKFLPNKPLSFNQMNYSKHDNLVRRLRDDIFTTNPDLLAWNLNYGVRKNNSCVGEIDLLDYNFDRKEINFYEVKSTISGGLKVKGRKQLTRIIDKYLPEFERTFGLPLDKANTYLVCGDRGKKADTYFMIDYKKVKL